MSESVTSRVRRMYARQGIRVCKIPERSRWYLQCGPFMLVDVATSGVMASCLTLDEVNDRAGEDRYKV